MKYIPYIIAVSIILTLIHCSGGLDDADVRSHGPYRSSPLDKVVNSILSNE